MHNNTEHETTLKTEKTTLGWIQSFSLSQSFPLFMTVPVPYGFCQQRSHDLSGFILIVTRDPLLPFFTSWKACLDPTMGSSYSRCLPAGVEERLLLPWLHMLHDSPPLILDQGNWTFKQTFVYISLFYIIYSTSITGFDELLQALFRAGGNSMDVVDKAAVDMVPREQKRCRRNKHCVVYCSHHSPHTPDPEQ